MRGLKKMALLGALMMIFSSAAVQVNRVSTDFSVIKNAAAEEAALENDKKLTLADSSSFNGIRVSVTGQVESDNEAYAYARRTVLYAGLGEGDRDLTNAESLSVQLKFVTTNSARLFVVLADGSGNTAVSKFFANRPNDGQPLGSKFYDESGTEVSLTETGSAWEGVTVAAKGTAGVLVCTKSGFYTAEAMWNDNPAGATTNKNEYGIADKTVTPDGTFDWSDVRRVMISFSTWNVNTVDVGNISAKYAGAEEKILFDAAESERKPATEIATLSKDEWAFAPRLNYIENWLSEKGGLFEKLGKESATITAARVKKNGFVFGRKKAATASDIWTKVSTPNGTNYGDITAYDAFSFDLDAETLTQNGQIDFILRVNSGTGTKDYRAYGNGADASNYFHYIDGEGELTTNSSRGIGGNVIPKGFKGSYMIPMNAFQGTSADDHPTQDELKNTVALLMVFIGAQCKGSETVSISNVKLIDDFAEQIPLYQVNNELSSLTGKVTEKNFAAQRALVEKAESGYHVTVGSFDRYMYSYYANDIASGRLTKAEADDLVEEFFLTFNRDSDLYAGVQQGDNGQSLVLGGKDENGRESFNDLSVACLKASGNLMLIDPKINLRVCNDTPMRVYELGTELTKKGLGFPQYTNDDIAIPALEKLGYSHEDACSYVMAACWELIIPKYGADVANIAALSFVKVIDKCLHNDLITCETEEAFLSAVKAEIEKECNEIAEGIKNIWFVPSPFMNVCMAMPVDNGGKYNNFGVHGTGIASAADSITAIVKYIYREKKLSKDALIKAVDENFENSPQLLHILRYETPKVGQNDDLADGFLCFLLKCFSQALNGKINSRGGKFRAGTGSAMYYLWHANEIGASPDGRRKNEPLGTNFSTSLFAKTGGPFSIIQSMTKPDFSEAMNGGPVTLEFSSSIWLAENAVQKFAKFIKTYIDMGGHQIQLNSVNLEKLKDAQKHPELYERLVVRIWGWSAYFTELDKEFQDHVMARQEYSI